MERPYLPGAYRCVNAAQKYPGLIDRGESRQVGSKHSERGPLDALSGACRVVRRLSKHYAVREGYATISVAKGISRREWGVPHGWFWPRIGGRAGPISRIYIARDYRKLNLQASASFAPRLQELRLS